MGSSNSPFKDGQYKHEKSSDQTVIVKDAGEFISTVTDKNGKTRSVMNYDLDDNRREV